MSTASDRFDAALKTHSGELRAFLLRRLPNPADADDLLQDALLRAHTHREQLRDPAALRAWLFSVTRRVLSDHLRKQRPAPAADLAGLGDLPAAVGTENEDPECCLPLAESLPCFVDQLASPYAETLRAVDLKGVSQKEFARELGLSHSAVKSRVQRARAQLEGLLRRCCHFELDARGNVLDATPRSPTGCCAC